MEIPTAVIHRLQSSLRETTGAASAPDAAPAPPFPSVADAVAAFDSGASAPASSGPRCGRCGAAGGLLRGAQSAVCVYCGCPFRDGEGGGIAFRDGAAYRWLLGSLGLDGSELVEFDSETNGSNKSKEAPKSGMIISDLLDLKLTCLPENKETYVSSITKEQPSSVDTLNLSGANLDSFFIERKEQATASAVPQTHAVVQEKQRTDSKSGISSRSEVHVTSKGTMSSQRTNQTEATPAFANWDADFQSSSSKVAAGDANQPDLFKSSSAAESFSFPAAGTAINPVFGTVNKTNMKSTILEHPENLASASVALVEDNLSNEKVVQPILESNSGIVPEPEFVGSYLEKNSVKSDQLHGKDDNEVNDDEAFDEWQEFAEGGIQGSLSHVGEHTEEPVKRDFSEIKTLDPWPVGSMESPTNVNGDSPDDWQGFASSSGQGVGDSMKSVLGSTSALGDIGGGLMTPSGEATTSTSLEQSLEPNPVDLWPVGNVKKNNTTEMVKEANDSLDDWPDFTTSGQVQGTSFDQAGDLMEVPKANHQEIDMDTWFRGDIKEPRNTDLVNGNNMLDDWQAFTGSVQAQQSSSSIGGEKMNVSFEQHEGSYSVQSLVNRSNKDATITVSTNLDEFDIWQDFAKSGHQQESMSTLGREVTSVSPEPAKDLDSLDLWLTSNLKESNNSGSVRRIDHSSDGWEDSAGFGQAQGSTEISGEGHLGKDPSGTETLDLWASSHANEKNLKQICENDDLFNDWQDLKNSRPQETSLQTFPDASLFGRPSALGPDALVGLEFGSFSPLTSSQHQKDKTQSSNEEKAVQSDVHLKSTVGVQQMGDFDSLSAKWPTKIHNNNTNSKPEPVNANIEKLLSQMHDLSFMLKDELSVPDKPVDHSKS